MSNIIHFKSVKRHKNEVLEIKKRLNKYKSACSLVNSKVPSNTLRNNEYKKNLNLIDLSSLCHILTIDQKNAWVTVEPRMTVRALSETLLKYGFMPPVVPEFTSITIGGAIMGAAIESSSHRYGQFSDSALEYEVLLGDGTLLYASPDSNEDLFYGLSGSYGTLALLTLAKIRIIPAKRYVKIDYHRFSNTDRAFSFLRSQKASDFLDGILINQNWIVGMEGKLTDTPQNLPLCTQKYPWKQWFYQHVYEKTKKNSYSDVMPIHDYLFRLDRGAFWMGRFLLHLPLMLQLLFKWDLEKIEIPLRTFISSLPPDKHPSFFFRLLFGWAFSSKKLYRIWHQMPTALSEKLFFIQDFYIPLDNAEMALTYFMQKIKVFPVWLCPVRETSTPQFLSPHFNRSPLINLGFYGVPANTSSIPALTKDMEEELLSFGGRKMLYSLTYFSEEFFSKIYNLERYEALRKKFHATKRFPSLYNKITNRL